MVPSGTQHKGLNRRSKTFLTGTVVLQQDRGREIWKSFGSCGGSY
jgi:hypothetical protein